MNQTLQPYGYADDNPIFEGDPSGLLSQPAGCPSCVKEGHPQEMKQPSKKVPLKDPVKRKEIIGWATEGYDFFATLWKDTASSERDFTWSGHSWMSYKAVVGAARPREITHTYWISGQANSVDYETTYGLDVSSDPSLGQPSAPPTTTQSSPLSSVIRQIGARTTAALWVGGIQYLRSPRIPA